MPTYKVYENTKSNDFVIAQSLSELRDLAGFSSADIMLFRKQKIVRTADFTVIKY